MELADIVSSHWLQLRGMTYELLDALELDDLGLKLDFERSQSIGYQFWCMLGAQESWISLIESGEWGGFSAARRYRDYRFRLRGGRGGNFRFCFRD